MASLAEAFPKELARVRQLLSNYEFLRGRPGVIVEPQIAMIKAAIENAEAVQATGSVIEMLASYEQLKGFTS